MVPPSRIVSLVPSLTEALFALELGDEVVAVTDYCVEPAERVADIAKVGGTKTPDLDAVLAMAPDLVVASAEENVRDHVEALIAAGLTVYVSLPTTVRRALEELADLARLVGREAAADAWPAHRRPASRRWSGNRRRRLPFCRSGGGRTGGRSGHVPVRPAAASVRRRQRLRRPAALHRSNWKNRPPPPVRRWLLLPDEPYPFAERHRAEVLACAGAPAGTCT
ncbi:MAG: helical backbone metal receptor [Dehalococcoidia bacterium]